MWYNIDIIIFYMSQKRISFSKYNAEHLYEYLRFYWTTAYNDSTETWTKKDIKSCGKFGCCVECEVIGKRLEKFIGPDSVKDIDSLIRKYENNRRKK